MNRRAVEFPSHGVDLYTQPIEIDVCAQHNNGAFRSMFGTNRLHCRDFTS